MRRQGSRLALTPEAAGVLAGQAAAAVGFTLLEAANLAHGAESALRKVFGWRRRVARWFVGALLSRYGWRLVESRHTQAPWAADRADRVTYHDGASAWRMLKLARSLPVGLWDLAEILARRTEAFTDRRMEDVIALTEAQERAARNELSRGRAEARAEELAVKLEEQAGRIEQLEAELSDLQGGHTP